MHRNPWPVPSGPGSPGALQGEAGLLGRRSLLAGGLEALALRQARADTAMVVIDAVAFRPAVLHVAVGTTVLWRNRDGGPHTLVSLGTPRLFRSRLIGAGEGFDHVFAMPGTHAYGCALHPHMRGSVVAG